MVAVSLKTVWAHKRRLVGTLVAVVLGVAFLSGTLLLGDTLSANFDNLFAQANGSTDVVVRSATKVSNDQGQGNRATIPASLATPVARVDGVATAVPFIDGYGQLLGADGKGIGGNGPPTRAGNWVTVASLNPYHLVDGRAPQADDEVVINRGVANTGNLHLGDTTTLLTPAPVTVHIVGIALFGSADGFGPSTFTGLTLSAAQHLLTDNPGQVTEIRVQATPGVSAGELSARIRSVLPASAEAITGQQLAAENFDQINTGFLGLVRNGLLAFAVVALLVAAFSIFNTFSILVAQRGRETALLRALGATRRQVITTSAVETLVVGTVGASAGWLAGVGLAGLLKAVFDAFGFALPAGGLVFKPGSIATAVLVGLAATVVAGVLPSIRASRVAPVAALRDLAVEAPIVTRRRTLTGLALFAGGVLLVTGGVAGAGAGVAMFGAAASIIGVVVLGPVAVAPVVRVLARPIAAARGVTGRLAGQNALRHPRRTAATAAALTIGVSVVALFTVFGASLKASASKGIDDSLTADFVVDSAGYGGQTGGAGFDPRLANDISHLPGVKSVTPLRAASAVIDGTIESVTVTEPSTISDVIDLASSSGTVAALDQTAIAVSRDAANSHHWHTGSAVTVTFPDARTATLTIAAIYDHRDLVGDYLAPLAGWTPHAAQAVDRQIMVKLSAGADPATVRVGIDRATKPFGNPRVQDRAEFRASATQGVNTILGLIYVMLALAIVIALMGIANTLSLSIHERSRELGLLRTVGQTRRQTRSMVRWESVFIAVFGTLSGVAVGTFLGWGLVSASSSASLAVFAAPPGQLVTFVIVGAIAGTLAGVRPARRAARLDILQAIDTA